MIYIDMIRYDSVGGLA